MKILHTADLHFSVKPEKLAEVVAVTDVMLESAKVDPPACIVLAGDTVDWHDGKIDVDSPVFRAAVRFVRKAAEICPVLIIRGTPSHDRETPAFFEMLDSKHQIYVASQFSQVWLHQEFDGGVFVPCFGDTLDYRRAENDSVLFTCFPSPERAKFVSDSLSQSGAYLAMSIEEKCRQVGAELPERMSFFHVVVAHGMLTGANMGSYIPEGDQEFSIEAFRLARPSAVLLGHVHNHSEYLQLDEDGNAEFTVAYSGSPGRLTFGEKEDKGCLMWDFSGTIPKPWFMPLPARKFCFGEARYDGNGTAYIFDALKEAQLDADGADVRFRFDIPENLKSHVDMKQIEQVLLDAGARSVKIERQILPVARSRAEGMSRLSTLPDKVLRYGDVSGVVITPMALDIAGKLEGLTTEELI